MPSFLTGETEGYCIALFLFKTFFLLRVNYSVNQLNCTTTPTASIYGLQYGGAVIVAVRDVVSGVSTMDMSRKCDAVRDRTGDYRFMAST